MSPERMSFLPDDAMKLAEEKFNIVIKEEWSSRCNNARQCEQNYLQLEPIIDDISEQLVISLQSDVITAVVAAVRKRKKKLQKTMMGN
jgi:hypothetical protein